MHSKKPHLGDLFSCTAPWSRRPQLTVNSYTADVKMFTNTRFLISCNRHAHSGHETELCKPQPLQLAFFFHPNYSVTHNAMFTYYSFSVIVSQYNIYYCFKHYRIFLVNYKLQLIYLHFHFA